MRKYMTQDDMKIAADALASAARSKRHEDGITLADFVDKALYYVLATVGAKEYGELVLANITELGKTHACLTELAKEYNLKYYNAEEDDE